MEFSYRTVAILVGRVYPFSSLLRSQGQQEHHHPLDLVHVVLVVVVGLVLGLLGPVLGLVVAVLVVALFLQWLPGLPAYPP